MKRSETQKETLITVVGKEYTNSFSTLLNYTCFTDVVNGSHIGY